MTLIPVIPVHFTANAVKINDHQKDVEERYSKHVYDGSIWQR